MHHPQNAERAIMKYIQRLIATVAILAIALSLTGCETTGESAGLGAIIGAAAGAIIGNQSGSQGEGAVIGAVLGGLVGLVADDVKKSNARKKMSAQQTIIEYDYQPTQGESLVFESSTIGPGVIQRGTFTTAAMQYALLGSGPGTQVTETRVIIRNGDIISKISSQKFTRNDGTWVSTQQFRIPTNWDPGQYSIEQIAQTNQSIVSGKTNFIVE
jgi:surface antigen